MTIVLTEDQVTLWDHIFQLGERYVVSPQSNNAYKSTAPLCYDTCIK